MEDLKRMLYLNQKFNILKLKIAGETQNYISDAYAYAWANDVYPALHESAEWHIPYEDSFDIKKSQIASLYKFLDEKWLKKKLFTFYELEDHFEVSFAGIDEWDRSRLIRALRYAYLNGNFDKPFWDKIIESQDHPVEANHICDKFVFEDEIYFN